MVYLFKALKLKELLKEEKAFIADGLSNVMPLFNESVD